MDTDWEKDVSDLIRILSLDEAADMKDSKGEKLPVKDWDKNVELGSDFIEEYHMVIGRINEITDAWKKIEVNIAITGESGSGKSSFINALRDLKDGDEDAAKIGCIESTQEPTSYSFKDSENVKLWDLPGVGTPSFPQESYLKKIEIERYDCIVLLSSCRFTQNDAWLANEIIKRHPLLNLIFVRTKVDNDFNNTSQGTRSALKLEEMEAKIRDNCKQELNNAGLKNAEIFLINSYRTNTLDFGRLSSALIKKASELKREALIISLFSFSNDVVAEKKNMLRKRMPRIALAGALVAVQPERSIRRWEEQVLMKEALFYQMQLGIDAKSVTFRATMLSQSEESVYTGLTMQSHTILKTEAEFAKFYDRYDTFRPRFYHKIPIFGKWLQMKNYFRQCTDVLNCLLEMCSSEEENLNRRQALQSANK